MEIENTQDINPGENIVMIVYGRGGVGKTSFAASAKNPLLLDFENGSKYLGERGFNISVVRMSSWLTNNDKQELSQIIENFDTIVVDPLGEAMDKLIDSKEIYGKKYRASDGGLTMAGWGEVKRQMRNFIKWLRDSGKNIIIVAHVKEIQTEEGMNRRIQVATGLSDEIPNMVDIIAYMGIQKNGDEYERVLYTPQRGGLFDSKDRTGRVPEVVKVTESNGWEDFIFSMEGNK